MGGWVSEKHGKIVTASTLERERVRSVHHGLQVESDRARMMERERQRSVQVACRWMRVAVRKTERL